MACIHLPLMLASNKVSLYFYSNIKTELMTHRTLIPPFRQQREKLATTHMKYLAVISAVGFPQPYSKEVYFTVRMDYKAF